MAAPSVFTKAIPAIARSCRWYQAKLVRRPYLVKGTTSAGILGVADFVSQKVRGQQEWDSRQTALMSCYGGLCIAPFCHNWYRFLERLVPIPHAAPRFAKFGLAAKRMLLDQVFAAPLFTGGFFISRGLVAGEDAAGIGEKMRKDYLKVLGAGAVVWPQAQLVNFFLVPLHFRVLYTNMVGLGWSTFTSVVASYDNKKEQMQTNYQARRIGGADIERLAALCWPELALRSHHEESNPR